MVHHQCQWWWIQLVILLQVLPHYIQGNKVYPFYTASLRLGDNVTFHGSTSQSSSTPAYDGTINKILQLEDNDYGCHNISFGGNDTDNFALVIPRGHCTFDQKVGYGKSMGASAVIITDSVEAIFNQSSSLTWNCNDGKSVLTNYWYRRPFWKKQRDSSTLSACASSPSCVSNRCVPMNDTVACCIWDIADTMLVSSENINVPVIRLTAQDSEVFLEILKEEQQGARLVIKRSESKSKFDFSTVALCILAVAVVAYSGWSTAAITYLVPASNNNLEEEEVLNISYVHVATFVIASSGFLILLYYVDALAIVVVVLFSIASVYPVANELVYPILSKCFSGTNNNRILWILSLIIAAGQSLGWFITRHSFTLSWLLQNIMGTGICISFLKLLRVPSLKVASCFLLLVFIYDIFFVFISPYIFENSVMLKVATGKSSSNSSEHSAYCVRYPETCTEETAEKIPLVFRIPKICGDGGVILGFGDVILPGLLIVFCAVFDNIAVPASGKTKYFRWMVLGYAVGLMAANAAVVLMQQGQPALLYLVPSTLGILLPLSWYHGNLKSMWEGSLIPDDNSSFEALEDNNLEK